MTETLGKQCVQCGGPIPDNRTLGAIFCDRACKQKDYRRKVKERGYIKYVAGMVLSQSPKRIVTDRKCPKCGYVGMISGQQAASRVYHSCTSCGFVARLVA